MTLQQKINLHQLRYTENERLLRDLPYQIRIRPKRKKVNSLERRIIAAK